MAELNLQSLTLDESKPYYLMRSMAQICTFVGAAKSNVILRFGDRYISPALALIIRALSDEMLESSTNRHRLCFNLSDYIAHPEMQQFFQESGLVQSMDKASKDYLERIGNSRKRGNKKFTETPPEQIVAPHRIDLIDLQKKTRSEQKHQLITEANSVFSVLKSAYPTNDFAGLTSMLIELFDNVIFHSYSRKAYSMAVRLRNGGYFVGIFDSGIGIPGAYEQYRNRNDERLSLPRKTDQEAIKWAMTEGHSTLQGDKDYPRGAGFTTIKDFIQTYGGRILIASKKGYFCFETGNEDISADLEYEINGTLFTMFLPAL